MSAEYKIKCEYGNASELIIVDSNQNTVSIINIIEQIMPQQFPTLLETISVIHSLTAEHINNKECNLILSVKVNENEIVKNMMKVTFESVRIRLLNRLHGIILNEPGKITISLINEINNEELHLIEIPILTTHLTKIKQESKQLK